MKFLKILLEKQAAFNISHGHIFKFWSSSSEFFHRQRLALPYSWFLVMCWSRFSSRGASIPPSRPCKWRTCQVNSEQEMTYTRRGSHYLHLQWGLQKNVYFEEPTKLATVGDCLSLKSTWVSFISPVMPLASQPTGMASWIIHDLLELTLGICIRSKTLNLPNAIEMTWGVVDL